MPTFMYSYMGLEWFYSYQECLEDYLEGRSELGSSVPQELLVKKDGESHRRVRLEILSGRSLVDCWLQFGVTVDHDGEPGPACLHDVDHKLTLTISESDVEKRKQWLTQLAYTFTIVEHLEGLFPVRTVSTSMPDLTSWQHGVDCALKDIVSVDLTQKSLATFVGRLDSTSQTIVHSKQLQVSRHLTLATV